MSNPHSAGKGTNRRAYSSESWRNNFDKIDFSKKPFIDEVKKVCNTVGDCQCADTSNEMTLEEMKMNLEHLDRGDLLTMDGYDDCIIGVVDRFNSKFILYDLDKVIDRLMDDDMDTEEAYEFFYTNQLGAWLGEGTPGFLSMKVKPQTT